MRIGLGLKPRGLRAIVGRPVRRKAEEETLIGCKVVDFRRRGLSGERFLICRISDYQATEIGDAFAFLELSVFVQPRLNFECVKLLDDTVAALAKILQVIGRPPVFQIAVRVELRALIVEAVRHFMTDYGADAAVIEGIVRLGVEERRLKNPRRENDFVVQGRVIGVDSRWRHAPLSLVHGLADFGQVARDFERVAAGHILDVGTAVDSKSRVVAPLVGIADLQIHFVELVNGLLACFRAHPVERFQIVVQRRHQIADEIANPVGMILSAAMMLRESFGLKREAEWIESAVDRLFASGIRTPDTVEPGTTKVGCVEFGERLLAEMAASKQKSSTA